ncbi:AAA family ATPase [Streptomyces sp. NPDC002580]|uniref:AAA family ATPase n=1 Tax=Streptomyces sp. NPDC002580 TaxID=3364653 RepID=UPI003673A194
MTHDTPLRQLLDDRLTVSLTASELTPEAADLLRGMLPEPLPETTGRAGPVYLRSITAAGWRGVGPETTLDLPPGPGLIVVAGRNGTGKSSFAEAAEMALTGLNARWDGSNGKARTAVWKEGWRNLHGSAVPTVAVRLTLDETGDPVTVRRTWYGAKVDEARTTVERADGTEQKLDESIDASMLSLYRPFLPYSELGSMVDGTLSDLHNKIARFIGLGQLGEIDDRLAARIKACKDTESRPRDLRTAAIEALAGLDDQRATEAARALGGRTADVGAVRALLDRDAVTDGGVDVRLQALATLSGPDEQEVAGALARLREAVAAAEDARHSDAEDARRLVGLLESALEHRHRSQSADCPVCGTADRLDRAWAEGARAEIERLQAEAAGAEAARRMLGAARRAVHDLVQPVPDLLRAEESELADLWREWALCRSLTDPAELANSVERVAPTLGAACRQVSEEAARRLTDRNTAWRPAAVRLAEWLDAEEKSTEAKERRRETEKARTWIRKQTDELRDERMAKFDKQSQDVWKKLCESSSVALGRIELKGTAARGSVQLGVSVDDQKAPAYSVMSQGELHSLALSLFIPRATHDDSPFGFLVIDDPVQSMDTQKVEGLATVLSECARHRQVVVFTHDTRLEQAISHLGIEATILYVSRESDSVVTVEKRSDPVTQAFKEARDVSCDPGLPQEVADRVIPAMCRHALEISCTETARRTLRDDHGLGLTEIEERIAPLERTKEYVVLALPRNASGDPRTAVESLYAGGWALINELNAGSHPGLPTVDDRKRLVERTKGLAKAIRRGRGTVVSQGGAR